MRILKYREDFPAVVLVAAVALAQGAIFFAVDSHLAAAGWVALLLVIQVSSGAICHNHHHVNTFRRRWLNRLYEIVLYLQTGTSPFSWTLHHNIGHHGHYLDPEADPAPWLRADGTMMHRLEYDLINAARIYPEIMRIGRDHPELYRRFKRMFVLANLPLLVLFLLDPVRTLIVFLIPMVLLLVILLDNTWGQHAGTDTRDHFEASRNVELPLYNFTSWNLGYHTAHHLMPGLHWSRLPELHEKIRHRIPGHLITRNPLIQVEASRARERFSEIPEERC